jgi:hypothetical protein
MKNDNKKTLRETLRVHELARIAKATEQRLRAGYEGSWMMSERAWKKFMLGDTTPPKE